MSYGVYKPSNKISELVNRKLVNHLIDQFEGVINMKKNNKNNRIKNILINQKGMALLTTLIFIFILVTFGVALLSMTSNDIKLSSLQRDSTKAFYIAEAGVEIALYDLKKDYENNKDWNINFTEGELLYDGIVFGDGKYTVYLSNLSSNNVTIKSKGVYIRPTRDIPRYVQVDAKVGPLSIWDNAIFAGAGAGGKVINGNVDIRGSVHLLGVKDGEAMDIEVEIGGTGGIGNNYDGMDSDLRSRIKEIPKNIEGVETLNAKLKVMHGDVNLSGAATVGDPDISGNSFKETLDGVYVNGDFGGNQGVNNVYSDEIKPYDGFIAGAFEFPTLDDDYISPKTLINYETYGSYLDAEACNITSLKDSDGNLLELDISSIDSTINSFDGYFGGNKIISWDNDAGTLFISGVIVIDVDFSIGDKDNSIVYNGKGTIVSKENISIHGNILAEGVASFPETNALGFVAYKNLNLAKGPGDSQLKIIGAFYAQDHIISAKQNQIAGTFVSDYCDMGGQVPSIYQVPGLEDFLPPGMPGAVVTYRIYTSNWHEVRE